MFKHIHIHHGDSGKVLRDILSLISEPCLFWLDAHHSGGITAKGELTTPVIEELKTILAHPICGHVVLIDGADSFGGDRDYPGLDEIREMACGWAVENIDGIIRITPISMKCS